MNKQLYVWIDYTYVIGVIVTIVSLETLATAVITPLHAQSATGVANVQNFTVVLLTPVAVSGDNVYIAWSSNQTGNGEIMFRTSNNSGLTFAEKINLSNTPDSDSSRVEIDSDANTVAVTWWEINQTNDIPVTRISNDNGDTFGPLLRLASNGTLDAADSGQ